ncbi:unnamed protein product [Ectocarpus sp. 8 AP-2014]
MPRQPKLDDSDCLLIYGVQQGSYSMVEVALNDGANVNGCEGCRPLVMAAVHAQTEIAQLLIERGAHVNAGVTNPSMGTRERVVDSIFLPMQGENAFHSAICFAKKMDLVDLLLRAGADPSAGNKLGITPLMCLAREEPPGPWLECALEVLIKAGVNPDQVDAEGWTAFLHAVEVGNPEKIRRILALSPAALGGIAWDGMSALYVACNEGHLSAVSCLLSLGAKHPRTTIRDHCPLAVAIIKGHEDIVKILLANLSAVGGVELAAEMALTCAITQSRGKILRMMLNITGEENAARWADSDWGLAGSLLHYSCGYILPASVSALLAAGANENATDQAGQRPIDVIGTMDLQNPPLSPLHPRTPTRFRDPVKEAEIRRTVQRAPAFRARSWAWPAFEGAGCSTTAAICGSATCNGLTKASRQGRKTRTPLVVQIHRPERNKLLSGILRRYPQKR